MMQMLSMWHELQIARVGVSGHDLPTGTAFIGAHTPQSATRSASSQEQVGLPGFSPERYALCTVAACSTSLLVEEQLPRNGKAPTWRSRSVSRTARAS
jgi:hypothetical protein